MKIYILNEVIVFNPTERQITSLSDSSLIFSLSSASVRCMTALLDCRPEVLTKDQILESVWRKYGLVVTENSVHQAITSLRKIFKESGFEGDLIITQQRVGYHLNPAVHVEVLMATSPSPAEKAIQDNCVVIKPNGKNNINFLNFPSGLFRFKLNLSLIIVNVIILLWLFLYKLTGYDLTYFFINTPQRVQYVLKDSLLEKYKVYVSADLLNNSELVDLSIKEITINKNISSLLSSENYISAIYINGTYTKKTLSFFFCDGSFDNVQTVCLSYIVLKETQ